MYHQCVYTDGKWREGRVCIISVFIQMVNGGRDVCVSSVCLYRW